MQSRFWSKSPDCFRFAEAFPKYNKPKLNIFPVARGISCYQQKFSNRHRKPRPNEFQKGGQDTMLVLVLCSFGMAADKYFFKLNQHHSLPSPGEGRELGEHRELGKLGETTPWMNPGASNKDVLNRAAELMLDSIFSGSPRRWSGASDHMAGEALTLSPPASPASPASPALFGDECLALTQTQGMAVIPATGEVIVCL